MAKLSGNEKLQNEISEAVIEDAMILHSFIDTKDSEEENWWKTGGN